MGNTKLIKCLENGRALRPDKFNEIKTERMPTCRPICMNTSSVVVLFFSLLLLNLNDY